MKIGPFLRCLRGECTPIESKVGLTTEGEPRDEPSVARKNREKKANI